MLNSQEIGQTFLRPGIAGIELDRFERLSCYALVVSQVHRFGPQLAMGFVTRGGQA